MTEDSILPPHGNYAELLSYQKTEIKLANVARASLEELLNDYRDYLRVRNLRLWPKDSKDAQYVRRLERDFAKEGGLRERMSRVRREYRKRSDQ